MTGILSSSGAAGRAGDSGGSGLRRERPADGVEMLVLDRPGRLNALDRRLIDGLLEQLARLAGATDVRAVILTGADGTFSAGADLDSIDLRDRPRDEIEVSMRRVMRLGEMVYALPQPTIAALSGPVVGGGLALALACDLRIAAPDAVFLSPFIHMGLVPDCGLTWLLARLIGESRALEFMLCGRRADAATAELLGLVTRGAVDPVAAALELAATIARRPPEAVRATKRLVRQAGAGGLPEAIEREAVAQAEAFVGAEFAASFETWRRARRPD